MSSDLVDRYFALAPSDDVESYFALFCDDAIVEDDGQTHTGIDAIRQWRAEVPEVAYTVAEVVEVDGQPVATADVSGDFAGSPVALRHWFRKVRDGRIAHLVIAP